VRSNISTNRISVSTALAKCTRSVSPGPTEFFVSMVFSIPIEQTLDGIKLSLRDISWQICNDSRHSLFL